MRPVFNSFCTLAVLLLTTISAISRPTIASEANLLRRAAALRTAHKATAASKIYRQILSRQPNNADAHAGLGWVLYELGDINNAITHEQLAITLDPNNAEPHYLLSTIYMSQNKYKLAKKEYELAQKSTKNKHCNCPGPIKLFDALSK